MGIKIYRDNNWYKAECGCISRRDMMGLDRREDWRLIDYLILHTQEPLKKMIMRKYRIEEMQ